MFLFNEEINLWRIIGILFAFLSVFLFAIEIKNNLNKTNDESKTKDTFFGCGLTLAVSLFWGLGDIFYRITSNKCLNTNHKLLSILFFNSTSGFIILITFCWIIPYLYFSNNDSIQLPTIYELYWILGISMLYIIGNIVQFISITYTSPFFLNIIMFLKIPMSFIVDVFVNNYKINLYAILGGLSVILGFLIIEIIPPPCNNNKKEKSIKEIHKKSFSEQITPAHEI